MRRVSFASPADILKANERDEHYLSLFHSMVEDSCAAVFGPGFVAQRRVTIDKIARIFYFCSTTLQGLQTPGQEYVDVEWSSSDGGAAMWIQRLVSVVGGQVLPLVWHEAVTLGRVDAFSVPVLLAKALIPVLHALHLGVFYLDGKYMDAASRVAGLRTSFKSRTYDSKWSYAVLGVLLLMQGMARAVLMPGQLENSLRQRKKKKKSKKKKKLEEILEEEQPENDDHQGGALIGAVRPPKCLLCYSARTSPTTTPCGHVFCWGCVSEWLNQKNWCPLCRSPTAPNQLTPLYGFV